MKNGFSLIEILVVLAIIMLMAGIVTFNISSQRQNSALFRSAQKLSLDLRRVQNYALSSKNFRISGVPCGWGIHFYSPNSSSYTIFADTAASLNCSDRDFIRSIDGSEDFETINLDAGIIISSLSNGLSDIVYTPPQPSVVFIPDQTTASIVLSNRFSTKTININKSGLISL
ncbi:MAG: hypothetical protein UV48_C0009G0025 [Candidatus Azambacteria bacterium GW2011_GWA2_42_9]|uniref:General secretion pathway GspH domain-containing protein n=3 Tax=Candidatus Azamiibacteriota TaxID=1752741 RepID=A0A0G0ZBY7_9BACT|nr:MAG: hypothetical protein UV07_C0002G0013 [Candidatus Azambacteria bacterium GW2011_GWB1_42_17]KKS46207.1 MAG: hypothetical protein UV10_C0006G0015 [Candidatus Azambacteria bacterium GW2011_GWA1_42_19]KKS75592.1 MAG: hypothetical protein UV48_C0009G0025 [Candidatus Azambacteria bacterium GW2011_GWA2_42_9]KKS88800.1 MAG: hypothetical protein UV62_C0002G0048 [Parcubacteria group bacterium GW2011_GWC1_43_11]